MTRKGVMAEAETGVVNGENIQKGWMLWPIIPYSFDTISDVAGRFRRRRTAQHWLGTDDTARDVLRRGRMILRLPSVHRLHRSSSPAIAPR